MSILFFSFKLATIYDTYVPDGSVKLCMYVYYIVWYIFYCVCMICTCLLINYGNVLAFFFFVLKYYVLEYGLYSFNILSANISINYWDKYI